MKFIRLIELSIERIMYSSRWILAPIYIGLSLVLLALAFKFFQEMFYVIPYLMEMDESQLILKILTLIDLTLVGSLIVVVMFSGYENFVSQLDIGDNAEKLDWLGTHDYSSLKMKVASSIVAISSIHLLKIFMNVEQTPNDKLLWYVVLHMTLVLSAFFMGYLNKLTQH